MPDCTGGHGKQRCRGKDQHGNNIGANKYCNADSARIIDCSLRGAQPFNQRQANPQRSKQSKQNQGSVGVLSNQRAGTVQQFLTIKTVSGDFLYPLRLNTGGGFAKFFGLLGGDGDNPVRLQAGL